MHIRISPLSHSRRPAAILGISMILLIGTLLAQNASPLAGQLTASSFVVRITSSGVEPTSLTLPPGATITWNNLDTKPHILSSDTLRTTNGLLYSTAIFPEEEFRATLVEDGSPGEYSYVSLTDPKISGTVRIDGKDGDPSLLSPQPSSLPKNPLVAAVRSTAPLQHTPSAVALSPSRSSPLPKPFRHPDTGIPLGISSLATLTTTLLLARRLLRSPHARIIRP